MSFSVEVIPELTNIISIETSFLDEIVQEIQDVQTSEKTLEIINNNYSDDINYTKNIVDIQTTNTSTSSNIIEVEVYQTYQLDVINDTQFLGNIHYSRIDGLSDFIDSKIPNEFDCGTP
jgi:hypothetical protein